MSQEHGIGQYSVTDTSSAACVAARRQERLEAWCLCLCRPTGVLCQPRPDPTRGHDQDQLERPPAAAVSPPAIRRPPAAASPRAMVEPQSSGGLPSLRTPSVTFTILSLARSSINLRILGPVVGRWEETTLVPGAFCAYSFIEYFCRSAAAKLGENFPWPISGMAPGFLMYKSRIAGERSFWVLRITLRIRDWLIF